jgi:baculoviral IAP repeat-containing protein 6
VLVSIQGMILIEAPYFNEYVTIFTSLSEGNGNSIGSRPGYGKANPNDPRSVNYNREIRLQTVRYAMVEWMKDKYKDHIWAVSAISVMIVMLSPDELFSCRTLSLLTSALGTTR